MEPLIYSHFEEASSAARKLAIETQKAVVVKRLDSGWTVAASQPYDEVPKQISPPLGVIDIEPSITPPEHDKNTSPDTRPQDGDGIDPDKLELFIQYGLIADPSVDDNSNNDCEEDPQTGYIYDEDEVDAKDLADREKDYWTEIGDYRDNSSRSSDSGWFHPKSEGDYWDNYSEE